MKRLLWLVVLSVSLPLAVGCSTSNEPRYLRFEGRVLDSAGRNEGRLDGKIYLDERVIDREPVTERVVIERDTTSDWWPFW